MKKMFFSLIAGLLLFSSTSVVAQSAILDLGIFKKPADRKKLEIRLRPTEDVVNGAYSGGIFTVRYPLAYGVALDVVPNSALYSYSFAGPVGQHEGYVYYRFQFAGSVNMVSWEKGKEYPIMTLQINGDVPSGARFELVTKTDWTRAHNADYYQELNGLELQRGFYHLPIKVRSFYAIPMPNRTVKLDWEFESDIELDHSEVEYSADGRGFDLIGQTPAHSETDRMSSEYIFTHATPQPGVNYYRIRMVDINGNVEYSPVRAVNFDDLEADFSLFPNPTAGPVTLICRNLAKHTAGVHYQLIDNLGKVVLFNSVTDDNVTLDLSKMPAGSYFLKVMTDQEQLEKFKIVVAH